jgi:prophage regulatory protein
MEAIMGREHSPVRLLRLPEVRTRTGLSRSSVYRLVAAGTFPKPVKVSTATTTWIESEVDAWIVEKIRESRAA